MRTNVLAARALVAGAVDLAEARKFLDMAGLLDGRQIAMEENRSISIDQLNTMGGEAKIHVTVGNRRPAVSTAPAALRVLPPLPKVPRVSSKPRSAAQKAGPPQGSNNARAKPCGTEAAARRHNRNNEPLCDACEAGRAARNKNLQRGPTPNRCGEPAGYAAHRRNGTEQCEPCIQANRDASNERRAKAAAKQAAA